MKKTTKLKAIVLSLMMVAMMLPIASFAQNDNIIQDWNDENGVRDFSLTWAITNNSFGTSPLGSGLLILTAVGAGYAAAKRRRNRKNGTMMLLAALMLIGMTNCKKNQTEPQNTVVKQVRITLDAGGHNGAKHTINTSTGVVEFEEHDLIYVGNDGKYIGTLECNDKGKFEGEINEPENNSEMYLYFVGGLSTTPATLVKGSTASFTVDISDQSTQMPVLSSNHVTYYTGTSNYSCELQNHCALVKFTIASTTEPVQVGGLYTIATINFATPGITPEGTKGFVTLNSESNTEKWAVLLPQTEFDDAEVKITNNYEGYKVDVPNITADAFITDENAINVTDKSGIIYLQWLTINYTATNGQTLTGTLSGKYKISIANGATVNLYNATITYASNGADWAGLTCIGDATIILADGTTNTVESGLDGDGYNNWPGIYVPQNKTLTINGNTGTLNARCGKDSYGGSAAGIGCGFKSGSDCGNIIINGGVINANGGAKSAGIGGVNKRSCGYITINGGTVTAIGDYYGSDTGYGAGIGTGGSIVGTATVTCGDITITGGNVTATGGRGAAGIGTGHSGQSVAITCGNITISGGTVIATGGGDADLGYEGAAAIGTGNKEDTGTVDNKCGDITITTGVTRVTATKGSSNADNSIGTSGSNNTCGTVTIGGTEYWKNNAYVGTGSSYLPTSPLVYPAP